MKKRNAFKILLLISILSLLFSIILSTYSKYVTITDNSSKLDISKWHILLNDVDIREREIFTDDIAVQYEPNENIAEGIIVPTSKGTLELELESTGTELPFKYDIQLADGDVDYESSYTTEFSGNYWSNDGGKTYVYDFELILDYSYLDKPIWYRYRNTVAPWDSGFYYPDPIPEIEIHFPEGIVGEPHGVINAGYTLEGNVLTLRPEWYCWENAQGPETRFDDMPTYVIYEYSSNILRQHLQLTYNRLLDFDKEDYWQKVSIDGKTILESTLPDYRITSYTLNDSEPIPVTADQTSVTGIVEPPKDANGKFTGEEVINKFVFYVEWYDGEDNILNNQDDVKIAQSYSEATIPLLVKIDQLDI